MAGTVTGRDANIWLCAHSGAVRMGAIVSGLTGVAHGNQQGVYQAYAGGRVHSAYGIGDFTLTLDKGTVEAELVGQVGNYFDQGSLSVDGSLTSIQFATSGIADLLLNAIDSTTSNNRYQYLAISGSVSDATDATYLSWFLVSCQVTGYDISLGDADTITEASIDFTSMLPYRIKYASPCIRDCGADA